MSTPIEDYAVVGDMRTAALISRDGSVDWLCLPRFDSPACFAALLGGPEHGRWVIRPTGPARTTRRYRDTTFVLETTHETAEGTIRVTDVMPLADGRADLIRRVEGLSGTVEVEHEWIVRFGYGKVRPWVSRSPGHDRDREVIRAVAGADMVVLRGTRLPVADEGRHRDRFTVSEGERLDFTLNWFPSWDPVPPPLDIDARVRATYESQHQWSRRCTYEGRYREAVARSVLVLKLLTDNLRGGIVAAPTTSLPEDFGGERNWDYRFCWLRDASLTLGALLEFGYIRSTELWRAWLVRAIAGDPEDMQIMYAVDGGRDLPERTLDHLPGYAGSTPVRIGNEAVGQAQTDVLGEVMIALDAARALGLDETEQSWEVQCALIDHLGRHWQDPDHGLWEMRGPRRHFTHSRIMVWAAFDRAVRAVEEHGLPGPVDEWRRLRDAVREEVLERGYDRARNTFTQHYDTTEVDASLLVMAEVGFLPPDDDRFLGTVAAIEKDLMRGGFLLRYRTTSGVDGLSGHEHPFLACSFWLVTAYALSGQLDKARELMDRLVGLSNDVGLLSEEYDPEGDRMVGNFPQAFSHLTLIGAARALGEAEQAADGRVTSESRLR
jgi:GH15 family glucan-1,4-alpha-glucosidase